MAFVNNASLALGGHDARDNLTEEQEERILAPVDTTLRESSFTTFRIFPNDKASIMASGLLARELTRTS